MVLSLLINWRATWLRKLGSSAGPVVDSRCHLNQHLVDARRILAVTMEIILAMQHHHPKMLPSEPTGSIIRP